MATDTTLPPPVPPAPDAPAPAVAPRWMRWLLVSSLALNLLVLGLVAGEALLGGMRMRHPRPADLTIGPVASAFAPADRLAILRELRGRDDLRVFDPRERQAAFAALGAALRADPYDAAVVEAALAAQAERMGRAESAIREVMLGHIAAMMPGDRAAFADRLVAAAGQERPGRD